MIPSEPMRMIDPPEAFLPPETESAPEKWWTFKSSDGHEDCVQDDGFDEILQLYLSAGVAFTFTESYQ